MISPLIPYHSFCANIAGYIDRQCIVWNKNDMVGMKLDLKERNVECFVNDENDGIILENISIRENGEKIKIDSFESL